jgi:hypothetical protein
MRIVREPLFHFLVLGALIFGLHGLIGRYRTDAPGEIVVTRAAIENLAIGFTRTWQRPPSEEELQGLVRDYIREEASYREALALGLDRDDTIVRRRLRQKLEFVSEDLATRRQPTDAELQQYLDADPGAFQTESRVSLQQIYFDPQRHGKNLRADASRALERLRRAGTGAQDRGRGDPFLLAARFDAVTLSDLKNTFGEAFASAVAAVPAGSWQGPIDSGYGTHLVYVQARTDSRHPPLSEVREQVRREYLDAKRRDAIDTFYRAILSRYTVRIEPLEPKPVAQVQ